MQPLSLVWASNAGAITLLFMDVEIWGWQKSFYKFDTSIDLCTHQQSRSVASTLPVMASFLQLHPYSPFYGELLT